MIQFKSKKHKNRPIPSRLSHFWEKKWIPILLQTPNPSRLSQFWEKKWIPTLLKSEIVSKEWAHSAKLVPQLFRSTPKASNSIGFYRWYGDVRIDRLEIFEIGSKERAHSAKCCEIGPPTLPFHSKSFQIYWVRSTHIDDGRFSNPWAEIIKIWWVL